MESVFLLKDRLPEKHPLEMSPGERETYSWGYSDEDKLKYVFDAEKFYQLLCVRYSAKSLTPYMMKLVLMKSLRFPISRFQSEGKRANNERSAFYHNHTTRHGGKSHRKPLNALLQASWNRLSFEIIELTTSTNPYERDIGNSFIAYCSSHTTE